MSARELLTAVLAGAASIAGPGACTDPTAADAVRSQSLARRVSVTVTEPSTTRVNNGSPIVTLPVRIANTSTRTVYAGGCGGGVVLERWEGGAWRVVWSPLCLAGTGDGTVAVAPGAEVVVPVTARTNGGAGGRDWVIPIDGDYRVRASVHDRRAAPSDGGLVSPPFVLREPPGPPGTR